MIVICVTHGVAHICLPDQPQDVVACGAVPPVGCDRDRCRIAIYAIEVTVEMLAEKGWTRCPRCRQAVSG